MDTRSKTTQVEISYAQMGEADCEGMSVLCDEENWGITVEYAKYLCSIYPAAAHAARSGGRLVGFCLGLPVNDQEAFLGLMLVDKDFRGRGIGKSLLERVLPALGDRNVSVYATMQAASLYRRFGFKSEENPTYLYQPKFLPRKEGLNDFSTNLPNATIVPLSKVNFQDLIAYDTDIHRIERKEWVRTIVDNEPESLAVLDDSDKILGYAGVYTDLKRNFTQLQPLLADSSGIATLLLKSVMDRMPEGRLIKFKIPSENSEAVKLIEKIGFSTETNAEPHLVMFTKYKFKVNIGKVYSTLNDLNSFA